MGGLRIGARARGHALQRCVGRECDVESQPKGATALFDEKLRAQREADRLKKEREGMTGSADWNVKHPSNCTYERMKSMNTMWVPSIVNEAQYEATKEFFASKGITTKGYIQWK